MDGTIEIITGRERRRRWSTSEKLRIVAETFEQGATVGDVAARHGAYRSLVFTWRRQVRDGLLTAEPTGEAVSPFVPVRLLDGPSQSMDRPVAAPSPPSPSPSSMVEISLPSGSVVRVDQHVDARALRRILGALRE
ncbi:MAG: transposase [Azospirillaceae bacterium]|nr:transposase [Azospirillaceae bacterium]